IVIGRGQCPAWVNDRDKWLDIDAVAGNPPVPPAPAELRPGALGAILYTSGSTGSPKGVALSHGAMLNFADWAARTFGISSGDRIASLAPLHFDLSVFDLFSSLNAGATVYFVPPQLTLSPVRLTAWLSEHDITAWYTVPSLLSFIAFKGALDATPLPALKTLLFAGEVFPTQHLIRLCELLPATELFNLYGPTETNVCCYWPVDRSRLNPAEPIPIGVPACESRLKIDAETGELWVKSKNNFTGYWQKGRLERAPSADGWHPTGDRVSRNDQGEFLYHGRLDRMLKCSGYRVEPAEIEAALRRLPGVENCAVVGLPDPVGGQRPAAAVVLKSGFELAESLKPLRQLLPGYMQPGRILAMDTLPLLSNGKTDYQALEKAFKNL
ncbi:MAG: AMP-binding protein, partial [Gammaproteobacteria bacterium]